MGWCDRWISCLVWQTSSRTRWVIYLRQWETDNISARHFWFRFWFPLNSRHSAALANEAKPLLFDHIAQRIRFIEYSWPKWMLLNRRRPFQTLGESPLPSGPNDRMGLMKRELLIRWQPVRDVDRYYYLQFIATLSSSSLAADPPNIYANNDG